MIVIGRGVRRARRAAGWSLDDLVARAGCLAPSTLSLIERGRRTPQRRTLRKLAQALDADVATFERLARRPPPLLLADLPSIEAVVAATDLYPAQVRAVYAAIEAARAAAP